MATIIYCLSYRKATRIVLSTSLVFIILMVPAEISTLSRMDTDQIANNVFMLMQLANHNIKLLVYVLAGLKLRNKCNSRAILARGRSDCEITLWTKKKSFWQKLLFYVFKPMIYAKFCTKYSRLSPSKRLLDSLSEKLSKKRVEE